jgi:hypothetical protein
VSIYFIDATLASAFVVRWCAGFKVETAKGVFTVRTDAPTPRVAVQPHRTPETEKGALSACRPSWTRRQLQQLCWLDPQALLRAGR